MTDNPEQSTSWGSVLAGLIVGAAVGAGLSLLYAPKPGNELREDIMDRLDDIRDRVDQAARDLADTARTRMDEVREDLARAIEGARETAAEHVEEMNRRMETP